MKKRALIALVVVLALAATASLVWANMDGPVSYWPFDEGSGITALDAADGNDGAISGDATYAGGVGIAPLPGNADALTFDGVDDFVEVAHADNLDMTGAYTISAWVKVDDVPTNIYRPILFRGTTDANDIEVYVQAITNGLVVAHNRGNGGTFDWVRFASPPIATLFHLVVTFDGTQVHAYYDGVAPAVTQNDTFVTAPWDTDKGWWIGKVDHAAFGTLPGGSDINLFKGLIDELGVWNRVLSAEEIAWLASPEVEIDIKPGSYPNSINMGANGVIPVAILTTDTFDAADVDPSTVELAGAAVQVRGKADKLMARLEDVDGDGDLDLVVQVVNELALEPGDAETTLTARSYDGLPLMGTDSIRIVPPE